MPPSNVLVLFARLPTPGKVKTRLIPILGAEGACELHAAMVDDIIARFSVQELGESGITTRLAILRDPHDPSPLPASWASLPRFDQAGDTLGERMARALQRVLDAGHQRVVLIGTDAPTLPTHHVVEAFEKLEHTDIVLGPATDGGYYLIGANKVPPRHLFAGIEWGTREVFAQTVAAAQRAGLSYDLLPPWYDVDDEADLRFLQAHLLAMCSIGEEPAPRTARVLGRLLAASSRSVS